MPEIQYESHRGRGIAVGLAAVGVIVVLVLGIVFRNQINDLLYKWGILHISADKLVQDAEKQRQTTGNDRLSCRFPGIDSLRRRVREFQITDGAERQ